MCNEFNKAQVAVGRDAWYRGKIYEVIAQNEGIRNPQFILWDHSHNPAFNVNAEEVEVPVMDLFEIGEPVIGTVCFEGTVVAYEVETNRVVCRSNKAIGDTRTRYAYKGWEIAKAPAAIFEVGGRYRLHATAPGVKAVKVYAEEHPQTHAELITLRDINTNCTVTVVPRGTRQEDLSFFGISRVEKIF